jgi:hypothetical protein
MKKMFILILLTVFVSAYGGKSFAQDSQFVDLSSEHWAHNIINTMVLHGYMLGYPDNSFKPEKAMSREEFAVLLVRCMGISPTSTDNSSFIDVPVEHWSARYIEAVKEYLPGYSLRNGTFNFQGTKPISREDVTAALVRAKGGVNSKQEDLDILKNNFKDYSSITDSLQPLIAAALSNELISGYPDGTFRPEQSLTRSQAAVLLYRAFCRTNSVIKNMISLGDITTINTSDQIFTQLSKQLNNSTSRAIIDGETYNFEVYVKNAAQNTEQLKDLIYVFVKSSAPFSFEAANKYHPEQVQEYMNKIKNMVNNYYPAYPLLIMTGFRKQYDEYEWVQTRSLFEDTDYQITKDENSKSHLVDKFFSGVLYINGKAIESF